MDRFSNAAPALADFNGNLYIAWTLGARLNIGQPTRDPYYGAIVSKTVTLPWPETSSDAPALAYVTDYAGTAYYTPRLYVGWTGSDDALNVNSSGVLDNNGYLVFSDRVRLTILDETSDFIDGLALESDKNCTTGFLDSPEGAFIAWIGTDSAHSLNIGKIHAVDFAWR